jgi:hypothetical protein
MILCYYRLVAGEMSGYIEFGKLTKGLNRKKIKCIENFTEAS